MSSTAGPSRRRAPFVLWAVLMAAGVAAEALTIANRATWHDPSTAGGIGLAFAATYGLAGAVILSRRPGNPVARIFISMTTMVVASQLTSEYAIYTYVTAPGALPFGLPVAWLSQWTFLTAFPVGLSLVFLFFPDGLPAGRWRRGVLGLAILGAAVLTFAFVAAQGQINPHVRGNGEFFIPVQNPTGFLSGRENGRAGDVQVLGWAMSGAALIMSVVAIVIRLFRETGERRQQLKWVAYLAAPVAPAFAIHFANQAFFNGRFPDVTAPIYVGVFVIGIPTAMAIAILKYRLYGIDVVISRTLVYGALAALITGVYVAIVVGIGTPIGAGNKPNLGLSILATAVVAVGFQPVRERLQKVANRLVYGKRATPYEVLSEFSERVAESYSADDVLPRMARVLAEGTGAEAATVWLRSGEQLRPAAVYPMDSNGLVPLPVRGQLLPEIPSTDRAVAVRHQDELLGALSVRKRVGESLTPIEEKLVHDLANQAGLVLKNVGLTSQLLQRLEDLRESRKRLVSAQDQERRKLERNLHDGAQQNLVAIKVKLGLAEMFIGKDPARAKQTLSDLKADTDEALDTLRDLARGIYPPLLAEKGLVAALEARARKATRPVEVIAENIARYPQEIEAAVYFCVLEALQNAQKYAAAASKTIVTLGVKDDALTVTVADDGTGFDPVTTKRGSGLTNMTDRLDALGGELHVESAPGRGTTIAARLPITAQVSA